MIYSCVEIYVKLCIIQTRELYSSDSDSSNQTRVVSLFYCRIKGALPIPVCVDRRSLAASSERDNDSAVLPLDYCLQNRASFREDRDNDSLNSTPGTLREIKSTNKVQNVENDSNTDGEKLNGIANKLAEVQNGSTAVVYRPKQDVTIDIDTSRINRHSIRRNSMEEIKRMMDDTSEDSDEDDGHKRFHLDHGDKWPTSFWTQFRVLTHRTFKQSAPIILSKLNFVEVGYISAHSLPHITLPFDGLTSVYFWVSHLSGLVFVGKINEKLWNFFCQQL